MEVVYSTLANLSLSSVPFYPSPSFFFSVLIFNSGGKRQTVLIKCSSSLNSEFLFHAFHQYMHEQHHSFEECRRYQKVLLALLASVRANNSSTNNTELDHLSKAKRNHLPQQ